MENLVVLVRPIFGDYRIVILDQIHHVHQGNRFQAALLELVGFLLRVIEVRAGFEPIELREVRDVTVTLLTLEGRLLLLLAPGGLLDLFRRCSLVRPCF